MLNARAGENWGIDISPTLSNDRLSTARRVALAGGSTRDSIKLSACLLLIDFLVYIAVHTLDVVNKYLLSYGQLSLSEFVVLRRMKSTRSGAG